VINVNVTGGSGYLHPAHTLKVYVSCQGTDQIEIQIQLPTSCVHRLEKRKKAGHIKLTAANLDVHLHSFPSFWRRFLLSNHQSSGSNFP